ncbi:hypothetical protein F2Q70_00041909 [Brassica cretica]|uniref:Uncharacterized protein n=1 Tax=Brassica cretica TaxID=69181 RepID=A0A8S9K7Z6_BRACR|nr:hypothetical protein F2Q70_00041909 [Brassica cretica]KAF3495432.1 hypothetical protein DY000_02057962 [Brassica cretica]
MASLRLWKKVATPLPSGWKMGCTTVAAPFSSSVENSDPIKAEKVGKMKVFQKLKSLTVETIDLILKEEEKKGAYVTQTDLVRWAKRIDKRNNRPENSLEIFRWMDKKKMMFSPSELELYVDLLGKVLHWFRVKEQNQTSGAKPHVLKFPKVDDPLWAKNSTPTTPAQKRNLFSKLKSSETCCAHLLTEMEDQGFCITKADLNRWIKLLEKQGQTQKALQIDNFKEWKYLYFYHQLRGTFNPSSVSWDPSNNIPDVT